MNFIECKPEDKEEDNGKVYKLFTGSKIRKTHKIYLSDTFEAPEKYTSIFNIIEDASKDDEIIFYLNSYGGRVDAGIQFGNKLRKTKAHTKTVIEGPSYSMGAIFPFMTKEVEMMPHTFLMFHDFSTGSSRQKGNEILLHLTNYSQLFKGLLDDYCSKLLTKEEIADIVAGKDLYLDQAAVSKRMGTHENKK